MTTLALPAVASGSPTLDTVHHCKAEDLLTALPDGCIDMILTSPPYDNLRTYKGFSWDFEYIARQSYRVLKQGGVLVWVVGDSVVDGSETLTGMKQAIFFVDCAGFKMHDTMIYQKDGLPFPDVSRYWQVWEHMFVLSKGCPKTHQLIREKTVNTGKTFSTYRTPDGATRRMEYELGKDTRVLENVWKFGTGYMKTTIDIDAFKHPAMFPEELARRHIATWSNTGDLVLDFFMGSGTTAKMARNLGRHYIGCDISREYVELARQRLTNTDPFQNKTVQPGVVQPSLFAALRAP